MIPRTVRNNDQTPSIIRFINTPCLGKTIGLQLVLTAKKLSNSGVKVINSETV